MFNKIKYSMYVHYTNNTHHYSKLKIEQNKWVIEHD